jgi:hypothetical protein
MPTPTDQQLLRMDGWPGGVNNRARETEQAIQRDGETLPSSQFLRKALNVDLTAEGHPMRRQGYALHTAGYAHSIYSARGLFFVVLDGQLMVGTDVDELVAKAAVNKYNYISYAPVTDTVVYTNGQVIAEVTHDGIHRPLSTPVAPKPTVAGPAAEQPEGWSETRQVAVTYIDAQGRETGASEAVIVGAEGTFTVDIPMPLPTGVQQARVYVSQINSEILYHAQTMLVTSPITIYPADVGKGQELETLNLKPTPSGQIVRHINGRLYVARNQKVLFSEPGKPHLTRPAQGIYMFSDYITLLEPTQDGIYVGTKQGVVFLSGTDPYDVKQIHVSSYAPVEHASARIPGEKFDVPVDDLPVWWGADGVMVVGLPGGQLKQLTRDRLAAPEFGAGTVGLREYEGMSHIVSSLRREGEFNNMGATDTVVAELRQNNIVLNA